MGGASSVQAAQSRAEPPPGWVLALSAIPPSAKTYRADEIEQLACAGRQVSLGYPLRPSPSLSHADGRVAYSGALTTPFFARSLCARRLPRGGCQWSTICTMESISAARSELTGRATRSRSLRSCAATAQSAPSRWLSSQTGGPCTCVWTLQRQTRPPVHRPQRQPGGPLRLAVFLTILRRAIASTSRRCACTAPFAADRWTPA